MGLIKKAIAIGGIYYVAKKVHESHKETQQCANTNTQQQPSANTPYPQQRQHQPESEQQQQPLNTSRALNSNTAHQSYCNGQCGGQCSFDAAEQYGFEVETKAPVYQEKALV